MNRIVTAAVVSSVILVGVSGCNSGRSHSHHVISPGGSIQQNHTHIHLPGSGSTGKRNIVRTPSRPRVGGGGGITRGRVSTGKGRR